MTPSRKAEQTIESGRKLLKEDNNSGNESDSFVGDENLENVHIFSDCSLVDDTPHSIPSNDCHVDGVMDPLPIYTEVPLHRLPDSTNDSHIQGIHVLI